MIYISYSIDGTVSGSRDARIVDATPETKAVVKAALGRGQNVNAHRAVPTAQEMTAEEAAQDLLARPDLYTVKDYDPYMRSLL